MNALESPPAIVFTTAYDEYAIEAFDALAVGYVLKPVRRERLHKRLEQARESVAARSAPLPDPRASKSSAVTSVPACTAKCKLIPVDEVAYFQSDQKYTASVSRGGQHLIDDSLKQLETEFADRFVRIHRSALVAVAQD